ncbi:MAG TPA: hypothetical protein VFV10_06685, partial [Gammaproteobacteria bacterium]|nr:hypothetical protein [Gammaproteobacteria bacterium]
MTKRRTKPRRDTADWERLLAGAAVLQAKVPNAVLVGDTAAALHAGHRFSFDHDHVIEDLSANYDEAIAALETIVGWRPRRRIRGKLVLGAIEGIEAGLRNQRRAAPLETTVLELKDGRRVKIPTVEEMLRIKAFLVVQRNATRDYLDVAALSHHLGIDRSVRALERMNELYAEFAGEAGDMLTTVLVKLTDPEPYDLTDVDLSEYKGIMPPWND